MVLLDRIELWGPLCRAGKSEGVPGRGGPGVAAASQQVPLSQVSFSFCMHGNYVLPMPVHISPERCVHDCRPTDGICLIW